MRDYAQIIGDNVINREICDIGLKALDIDEIGLDGNDRLIMRIMRNLRRRPHWLRYFGSFDRRRPVTIEDFNHT